MKFFKHDPTTETIVQVTFSEMHNALGFAVGAMLIEAGWLRTGGIIWECRNPAYTPVNAPFRSG